MPEASVGTPALIEWGVATLALPGEAQSGDLYLVKPVGTGVLVAVVDGLGHGAEAATVAQAAVTALERHATESPLRLIERCHRALQGTRGAVIRWRAARALSPGPPRDAGCGDERGGVRPTRPVDNVARRRQRRRPAAL